MHFTKKYFSVSKNHKFFVARYEKILQIKPNIYTENRWVEFECGNKLAIYNRKFDEEKINSRNNVNYNDAYIKDFNKGFFEINLTGNQELDEKVLKELSQRSDQIEKEFETLKVQPYP